MFSPIRKNRDWELGIRNSWNHVMNISSKLCSLTKILCFEMQSGSFSIHSSFPTSVTFSSSFEVALVSVLVAESWLLGVFWWVSIFSERKKKRDRLWQVSLWPEFPYFVQKLWGSFAFSVNSWYPHEIFNQIQTSFNKK